MAVVEIGQMPLAGLIEPLVNPLTPQSTRDIYIGQMAQTMYGIASMSPVRRNLPPDDFEDLVQHVVVSLLFPDKPGGGLATFDPTRGSAEAIEQKFQVWLFTCIRNAEIDKARVEKAREVWTSGLRTQVEKTRIAASILSGLKDEISVYRNGEAAEVLDLLESGLTYEEISEKLHLTVSALKSRVFEVRQRIEKNVLAVHAPRLERMLNLVRERLGSREEIGSIIRHYSSAASRGLLDTARIGNVAYTTRELFEMYIAVYNKNIDLELLAKEYTQLSKVLPHHQLRNVLLFRPELVIFCNNSWYARNDNMTEIKEFLSAPRRTRRVCSEDRRNSSDES